MSMIKIVDINEKCQNKTHHLIQLIHSNNLLHQILCEVWITRLEPQAKCELPPQANVYSA